MLPKIDNFYDAMLAIKAFCGGKGFENNVYTVNNDSYVVIGNDITLDLIVLAYSKKRRYWERIDGRFSGKYRLVGLHEDSRERFKEMAIWMVNHCITSLADPKYETMFRLRFK